jgi:hypothetical protein
VDELPPELLDLVRGAGTLCLNPEDPGWDNARGYLFDESSMALYFPVSQKYRPLQPEGFRVLIWSQPRVVVTGDLQPEKARYMLVDQRTNKPRRTRFKLLIRDLAIAQR